MSFIHRCPWCHSTFQARTNLISTRDAPICGDCLIKRIIEDFGIQFLYNWREKKPNPKHDSRVPPAPVARMGDTDTNTT